MLQFPNNVRLVESPSDLPPLPDVIDELYLDFETSSGNSKLDSLNPWHHCVPCGAGITWNDMPLAYYVPWPHRVPEYVAWLRDVLKRTKVWINHNIKYDAHVLHNNVCELPEHVRLRDTIVDAKLINSDLQFQGGYGLDNLCALWLKEDIHPYEDALKPYLHKNKDYGRIPLDIIAPYGGQDVLSNRRLAKYTAAQMPEQCLTVWNTEQEMTRVLFDIEQTGLCVDPTELRVHELYTMREMTRLSEELTELVGWEFRPHTNDDCFQVFCEKYGLPVVGWTDKGEPSFSKHALANYLGNPLAPQDVVKKVLEYRILYTGLGFFIRPYQELNIDGILHSTYNQLVRTGRMSCKWPNSQQLNKAAKELVHPRPGNAFLSCDYSQIEFRWIIHYINDRNAIEAYHENPDTDFHTWVAEMCGIKRRPAKTVNFMIAFGGGKRKTIQTLSANGDVITDIKQQVEDLIAGGLLEESDFRNVFNKMCVERGTDIFNQYHRALPGIKYVSRKAAAVASHRGYVYNAYGRHRRLPTQKAHIAFNTINQSSAADLLKERTVAIHKALKGTPIKIVASVHDETLFEGPEEVMNDPRVKRDIACMMESPSVDIRVPVRTSAGVSSLHWREAGSDDVAKPVSYEKSECEQLGFLK